VRHDHVGRVLQRQVVLVPAVAAGIGLQEPVGLAKRGARALGRDPGDLYRDLTAEFGEFAYERVDAPASPAEKARLAGLSPEEVSASDLAGEPITARLTTAPGNHAPVGGLKVVTPSGWFAARPSGTENVYKLYAESVKGEDHLRRIQEEAQAVIQRVFHGEKR